MEQKYPNLLTEECRVPKPDKVLKYGTAGERCRERFKADYFRSILVICRQKLL